MSSITEPLPSQALTSALWGVAETGENETRRLRDLAVEDKGARPRSIEQLGFARMPAVRWFCPSVLFSTATRLLISRVFGGFLDKRELQQAVPAQVPTWSSIGDEVWFDFIADTGDGFDAAYSVAWLASQATLDVPGLPCALPRGQILVLGGDEVYPIGSSSDYESRFIGPFKTSLPYLAKDNPTIVTIPGNHDWYDGLTSFTRAFCQQRWIGGRRTVQTRSYFAVELVQDWWLWGVDIQFDTYIDEPQLRYFEEAARAMSKGGRQGKVILCTAKPSWVDVAANPESFRNLAYVESHIIRASGGRLMLSLSGDSHHYAHYRADDGTHKLTAGGGGAFLHPTHHLDAELDIPDEPTANTTQHFSLVGRQYPSRAVSRRLSVGAIGLGWRNPSFLMVPALLYLVAGVTGQFAVRAAADGRPADDVAREYGYGDVLGGLFDHPLSIVLVLAVLGGLIGFAKPPDSLPKGRRRSAVKLGMGAVHAALQLLVGSLAGVAALEASWPQSETLFGLVWLLWIVVFGSVAASVVMGSYLAACCGLFKAHTNEAYAAMALTGYKNFLRIHISREGVATVYPIGLRKANRRWRIDGGAIDEEAPWLAPEKGSLHPLLIDGPIVIDPRR